jgi:AraC family transcriptional regulator, transcriptional activator of pobA
VSQKSGHSFFFSNLAVVNQLFEIYKLYEEDAQRINASPNEPHGHDFEELLIGIKGGIEHFIDFKTTTYSAPFVSFVTKGKVHRLKPLIINSKFDVIRIKFRSEFIPETTFQLYSYYHDHANLQLEEGECFNRMPVICDMMLYETQQPDPDYAVIRQLLSALFTMIESLRKKAAPDDKSIYTTQNITFRNFLQILEENFRRPEGVEFYAEKLFMSARNLNLITHNILQMSVSEIIETRKLIEAKNLLINTDKTISEIGYELGYNEKSYFTNVFKKKSGQTPSEFRGEMSRLIS